MYTPQKRKDTNLGVKRSVPAIFREMYSTLYSKSTKSLCTELNCTLLFLST